MTQSLTVSRGGVRIHKSVVGPNAQLPMVAYVLSSEREHPVLVRVREQVPEPVPRDAIRLHRDYEADCWRVTEDGHLEYGRELQPGRSTVAGFFVRGGIELAQHFTVAPTIEEVRLVDETALTT